MSLILTFRANHVDDPISIQYDTEEDYSTARRQLIGVWTELYSVTGDSAETEAQLHDGTIEEIQSALTSVVFA